MYSAIAEFALGRYINTHFKLNKKYIYSQSLSFLIVLPLFKLLSLLEFNLINFHLLDSYLSDWLTFIIKWSELLPFAFFIL